eukprot:11029993-Ditylum_brightwellii.AAC.1
MESIGATLAKGIHPAFAVLSDPSLGTNNLSDAGLQTNKNNKSYSDNDDKNQSLSDDKEFDPKFDPIGTSMLHLYHACDTMVVDQEQQCGDKDDNNGLVLVCDNSSDESNDINDDIISNKNDNDKEEDK